MPTMDNDFYRWDDAIARVPERYREGYTPWDHAAMPKNLVEAVEAPFISEWVLDIYRSLGLSVRIWRSRRWENPIHDEAVVNFFFPEKDYRSKETLTDSLLHEVCHAIVWHDHGRIGTNQWGLGNYFNPRGRAKPSRPWSTSCTASCSGSTESMGLRASCFVENSAQSPSRLQGTSWRPCESGRPTRRGAWFRRSGPPRT